ncbi:MAG: SoxR reducing system RseC family protein [Woeseia sp.]
MNTPTARVTAIHGERVTVSVDAPLTCARCAAGKGCGAGLLGRRAATKAFELPLPAGIALRVGDEVTLNMQPERLLQASLWAYGLPLAAMLLGPVLGHWLWGPLSDGQLALASLAGLVVAFAVGRQLLVNKPCAGQLVPTISGHRSLTT